MAKLWKRWNKGDRSILDSGSADFRQLSDAAGASAGGRAAGPLSGKAGAAANGAVGASSGRRLPGSGGVEFERTGKLRPDNRKRFVNW